ncbi:uncharacterized protein Dere_GG19384 [Drosophila erecta]|uniref:Uncharacterized protein n=1 Tax=Drosophila erecta TaxID=7220 RepID=A0A0Q5TBI5_DROER|nr:uncharacterized protein Dere_GG19384 [Drosophila erecta]
MGHHANAYSQYLAWLPPMENDKIQQYPNARVNGSSQMPVRARDYHFPNDPGHHANPYLPVVYLPFYYIPLLPWSSFAPFGNTLGFYQNGCWYNTELNHRAATAPPPATANQQEFLLAHVVYLQAPPQQPQMVIEVQQAQTIEFIQHVPPPPRQPTSGPPSQLVTNGHHRPVIYVMPAEQPHYIPVQNPQSQTSNAMQRASAPPIVSVQESPQHHPPQSELIQTYIPAPHMHQNVRGPQQRPPSKYSTTPNPAPLRTVHASPQMHLQVDGAHKLPSQNRSPHHPDPFINCEGQSDPNFMEIMVQPEVSVVRTARSVIIDARPLTSVHEPQVVPVVENLHYPCESYESIKNPKFNKIQNHVKTDQPANIVVREKFCILKPVGPPPTEASNVVPVQENGSNRITNSVVVQQYVHQQEKPQEEIANSLDESQKEEAREMEQPGSPEPELKNMQSKVQIADTLPEARVKAPLITAHPEPIHQAHISNSLREQDPQPPTTSASSAPAKPTTPENRKCIHLTAAPKENLPMPQKSEVIENQWPALGSRLRNKQSIKKDFVQRNTRFPKSRTPIEKRDCALTPRNQRSDDQVKRENPPSSLVPPTSPRAPAAISQPNPVVVEKSSSKNKTDISRPLQEDRNVVNNNTLKRSVAKKLPEHDVHLTNLGSNMFELLVEPDPHYKEDYSDGNEDGIGDGDTSEQDYPKADDVRPPKPTNSKKEKRRLKKQNTALKNQRICRKQAEKEAKRAQKAKERAELSNRENPMLSDVVRTSTPEPDAPSPATCGLPDAKSKEETTESRRKNKPIKISSFLSAVNFVSLKRKTQVMKKRSLFKRRPNQIRKHKQTQTNPILRLHIQASDTARSQGPTWNSNPQLQLQPQPNVVDKDAFKLNRHQMSASKALAIEKRKRIRSSDEVVSGPEIFEDTIRKCGQSTGEIIDLPLHLHAGDEKNQDVVHRNTQENSG